MDDFSSKLDLTQSLETVESIDANHTQMCRCEDKMDARYRAISGVLKQSLRSGLLNVDTHGSRLITTLRSDVQVQQEVAGGGVGGGGSAREIRRSS